MDTNFIIQKLDTLKEMDSNWVNIIKEEIETQDEEFQKNYFETWNALREGLKKNQVNTEEILQKYGKDVEWLIKDVEESLQIYFSFKFLRVLQKENSKKVKEILNYLLENAIIYFIDLYRMRK